MTVVTEVAKRYAAALFEANVDKSKGVALLQELRTIEALLASNGDVRKFLESPLISGDEKAKAVQQALANANVTSEIKNLMSVLAANNRISEWAGVVSAFEAKTDEAHKVVRGNVKSAAPLGPEHRSAIEAQVAAVTGKKVVLEYREDKSLIGGLVAEVGSLTFDDSLDTQLRLMNEELKRRSH